MAAKSALRGENLAEDAEPCDLARDGKVCFRGRWRCASVLRNKPGLVAAFFFGATATEPNRDFNGSQRTSLLYMGGKGDSTKPSPDCVGLGFWPLRCKEPFI